MQKGPRTVLRRPFPDDEDAFLAMVRRSRKLHHPYVQPPSSPREFREYIARMQRPNYEPHLLCLRDGGDIVGVFNVYEIVRGPLQSANLGYYGAMPHQGQGLMQEGIALVLRQVFIHYKLHRLEANVQPENRASLALVQRSGFRREGFSPRLLRIGGRWRDHERYAMLAEEWRALRRRLPRSNPKAHLS